MTSDKRSAILKATLKLISANGFHGTAMSKVAKEAGVSAGIIYHYFDGKEDLIDELYRQTKYDLSQALLRGYSMDEPIEDIFRHVWLNTLHYYMDHPKEMVFLEQYENSPYVKPETQAAYMGYFAPLVTFIQQGITDGHFKSMPEIMFSALTIEVAMSLAKKHHSGMLKLDDALTEIVIEACWDAVKAI